ncbi:MAG: DUF3606 domain-containing protein, partial [Variovorax sp.]
MVPPASCPPCMARQPVEVVMPDDTAAVGGPDPSMYINMEEDYEVKDWAKALGVTE